MTAIARSSMASLKYMVSERILQRNSTRNNYARAMWRVADMRVKGQVEQLEMQAEVNAVV